MREQPAGPRPDPLFQTRTRAILDIWDQMQRLQTDFAFAQELTFYYTSPQWLGARSVLDLGTGNGYYLNRLAARFGDRVYRGVDLSAELIAIAEKEAAGPHVTFEPRDLFDVKDPYEFVLMRLLLQHVDDMPAVLEHVASVTRPGHAAFIIDADDALRFFHPPLPEFTTFFAAYAEHEARAGRDRRVATRVADAIAGGNRWHLGDTLRLLIPSTIGGNLELFTKTYTLLLDLIEEVGEIDCDFDAVRAAWRRWSSQRDAYTHVGLNLIRLDRV